jgi:aspartokinase/homoserine dehydrogenase 1
MTLALKKSIPETDPEKKKLSLFIAGVGAVGGTLLEQITALNHPRFELEVIGFCNSSYIGWHPTKKQLEHARSLKTGEKTDWTKIPPKLIQIAPENLIFVDATGSETIARIYGELLENGIHVTTPSKRANTFEQEYFERLTEANNASLAQYRFETTVGAGLPVISTIRTLLNSGDEITKISGVASGTMTFLFTQLQKGVSFSEAVRNAKEEGYSEPDPRDDLSGEDVARKFLILARTCEYDFERGQIRVDTLVPENLISLSTEEFLQKIPEYDAHWKNRNAQAMVNNRKLRYVGEFTPDGITVGVKEVKADSPLANLKGTDNLLQIYTKRYADSPIVIQGPGAGKDVTAAGILGDIIDIGRLV